MFSKYIKTLANWNKFFKNYKKYLKRLNKSSKKILKDAHLYLFGSILEGKLVGGSDIDILIIADVPKNHIKRAEIIAKIEEKASLPLSHPFEIHLITKEELEKWSKIYKLRYRDISSFI
ncbi:MAG: nucleotidyltransferase domain-containing protein [Promethearchaeota archaeon]